MGDEGTYGLTDALRAMLDEMGIRYTEGYLLGGRRVSTGNVTCVWIGDVPSQTVTLEEDEDGLTVVDGIDGTLLDAMLGRWRAWSRR